MPNPVTARRVFLVEERPNPSSDYFVLPALKAMGAQVIRCNFKQIPRPVELEGAAVVFVRYVPRLWRDLVQANRGRLAELVFFMDDDVLDVAATDGLPLRYRWKLARLAAWRQAWLRLQDARLWVSTPYLLGKYAEWEPRLISPALTRLLSPHQGVRVFYHGSASHRAEIDWLYPVVEAALHAESRLTFEIIGGRDVYRRYRNLPRTSVVHPMSWPAYQAFLAIPGRQIGLAPLLDRPFNRARACTKFFDITEARAVGIYALGANCARTVRHGENGWLRPMDETAWIDAILHLARHAGLRESLLLAAQNRLREEGGG